MTIKTEKRTALDLSIDNDILVLKIDTLNCKLAAVAMISNFEPILSSQIIALKIIGDAVKKNLPDFEPWLLIGHSTWQPDTKIIRYKKLSNISSKLNYKELCLGDGKKIGESIIESDHGVKFFDACQCDNFDIDKIIDLQQESRVCTLVYAKKDEALDLIQMILKTGWERGKCLVPLVLLHAACSSNLLVCCPIGEFDDVEAGYAILGQPEIVSNICLDS